MSGTPLSKQETKIIASLSNGSLYKEIASDHNISINTVKKHLKSIYRKLNVNKRTQATEVFLGSMNANREGLANEIGVQVF